MGLQKEATQRSSQERNTAKTEANGVVRWVQGLSSASSQDGLEAQS